MSKFKKYKKQENHLYYQSGGFNMDFFKNIAGNWKNFMKDPESAQSQNYLNDLVDRNKNVNTQRKTIQDKLILPDNEFDQWGDQADQAYTEKIWEKNYASKYGDWKSLSQDQQYDAWKKHKYSRPGWFNDDKLGSDLHASGSMYDQDKATRAELADVNKQVTNQLAETGSGIFSIMEAQKMYDNKPKEKFNLDFSNDKGIMRSQSGGNTLPQTVGISGPEIYRKTQSPVAKPVVAETVNKPPVDIVNKLQQYPYNYSFPNDFDTFSAESQKALVDSYITDFNQKQKSGLDTGMQTVKTIITPLATTLNSSDTVNQVDEQDAWFAEQIRSGKEGTIQYFNGKPIKIERSSNYKKRTDTSNSTSSTEKGLAKDIYNKPKSFQSGGKIPTSSLGLYKHPGQTVNVPSGNITMKGINYPVLAIPNSDKPEVMYPGKDYQFQNSNSVLEVPMMKSGGYPFTDYGDSDPNDEDVKDQIRKHEGAVVDKYGKHISYADSRGFKTIGYGHLWKKGDPKSLTQKQAEELFNKDYRVHKKHAENIPGYGKANANQKKALINLTYNMGANWYKKFPKFTKAFEEGNHVEAANQLRNSKWAKQVGKRSDDVINTFLSDDSPQVNNFNQLAQQSPATTRYEENVDPIMGSESDLQQNIPTKRAFDFLGSLRNDHSGFFNGLDFSSI